MGRNLRLLSKKFNLFYTEKIVQWSKKRHLVKPFIGITTNGYYLDIFQPYDATSNEASILNDLLSKEEFRNYFKKGDIFIVDRGFKDSVKNLVKLGFEAEMSAFLNPKAKQVTWQ